MSIPTPYLDPLNQALADDLAKQPPIGDLTIEQFRALFEKLQHHDPIPGVIRTSFTVPFEDGVKTFIFKPKATAKNAILPVVFYFHGGGWVSGSVNSYDSICRDITLQTNFAIVFPEYTLAPQAHYPTQQEQCYAVVKWVHKHGHTKGLSQDKFAIVGDSAGGQLTIATTILCSTRTPKIPIAHQTLLHPVTDTITTDRSTRSEFTFFDGPLLTVPFMHKTIDAYIPSAPDRDSELASPRNISTAHAKLQPPTLIVNSSADPLRDDGRLFGEVLQRQGVECVIFEALGQLHVSEVLEGTRGGATPRAVVRVVAGEIRGALGRGEKRERVGDEVGVKGDGDGDGGVKTRKRTRTRSEY